MDNLQINKELRYKLFEQVKASERKRMNYDLRISPNDGSQRMLNALMPGTVVPIHRHSHSNENVLLLCGKLVEVYIKPHPNSLQRAREN